MITKDEIRKQIVCYWSAEDESFIAESAAVPDVMVGLGKTREESIMDFDSALNDMYDSLKADKVAGYKAGRPSKNYVPLNVNLRQATKNKISALANAFKISQGEAVDYLMFFYECKVNEIAPVMEKSEIVHALKEIPKTIADVVKAAFGTNKAQSPALGACNASTAPALPNFQILGSIFMQHHLEVRNTSSNMQEEISSFSKLRDYVPVTYNGSTKNELAYAGVAL